MIREQGIVERVKGEKALLRIERTSACATCESRGSCDMGPDKKMMLEVTNELGARAGDRVEVSIPSGSILKLSLLVYLFPVIALIGGAWVGDEVAPLFSLNPTAASVMGAAISAWLAFVVLRRLDRRFRVSGESFPRMTRILL